ncbi:MAG: helix-turn-helix domain-containing protein [Armatimonadaceae bacterium]
MARIQQSEIGEGRRVTPAPVTAPLVTGHFSEWSGYVNWRPRGTNDYLLMLTLHGSGRIGQVGKSGERLGADFRTQPGDAVLIRPGTPHDYGTAPGADGWELLWAHFLPRSHWHDWLLWSEVAPGIGALRMAVESDAYHYVTEALSEMHQRARGGLVRRTEFAMNALEEALLWCDSVNPEAIRTVYDMRIAQAMAYLRERLGEPVSAGDVADVVGLSVSRFAHLFREQVGETPQQFIERERMARAQELLALTGRSVAAIAEEVGYENPFYFTLRFRKRTGYSPREWRRRSQSGGSL